MKIFQFLLLKTRENVLRITFCPHVILDLRELNTFINLRLVTFTSYKKASKMCTSCAENTKLRQY